MALTSGLAQAGTSASAADPPATWPSAASGVAGRAALGPPGAGRR